MKRSELVRKKSYVAPVDRISNSGNGVIQYSDGHIILGPMEKAAVGEEVEFTYWGHGKAHCASEYMKENSENQEGRNQNTQPSDPNNKNKLLSGHL